MVSRRILMVIAPEAFRDEELLVPREYFTREGWQVDTASTQVGEVFGMLGAKENVELTVSDVTPDAYDAVVVVGGMGSPSHLWENAPLHQIIRALDAKRKVVSAICLSGAVLAKAGVLQGKKATVWEMPESVQALKDGGAQYTAAPATVDGHIITANGPEAAADFAREISQKIKALAPAQ